MCACVNEVLMSQSPPLIKVNMPVDSFESPLTLAACGGHYDLVALLISRGADLEEVNDEG